MLTGQDGVNVVCSKARLPWFGDLAKAEKLSEVGRTKFKPHQEFPNTSKPSQDDNVTHLTLNLTVQVHPVGSWVML